MINTGRYEDAEPLYDEALSIRRRVLGADHPDTAISLNNLAAFVSTQGRYEEGRCEEALAAPMDHLEAVSLNYGAGVGGGWRYEDYA